MTTPSPHPDPDHTKHPAARAGSDRRVPRAATAPTEVPDLGPTVGATTVPITVWRAAGIDQPARHQGADGFTPRLAALLVGAYTRTGDTILDLSCDPTIEGAAGAGARRYLPVHDRATLTDVGRPRGGVGLIVLRWPTHTDRLTPAMALDLFGACRSLLTRDGHTIVVLALPPGSGPYIDHAQVLIPAAHHAGLLYRRHIVAVTAPAAGEHRTTRAKPTHAAPLRDATHLTAHLDLLVFELRGGRHG